MPHTEPAFIPLNIALLTVSDTRTEANDMSGNLLAKQLKCSGHQCFAKTIVADDIYQIRATVSDWIAQHSVHVIITTGGTGVTSPLGAEQISRPGVTRLG